MNKVNSFFLVLFQWVRRILISSFLIYLLVFTTIIFGIQIPFIQKKLVDFATQKLAEVVNYPIKIGGIKLTFTGGLILQDVLIEDIRKLDMVSVREIRASFKLISLLGKDIILQKVTLKNANVKLRYYPEVDDVNFSDFIFSLQHIGEDSIERNKPSPPHVGRYTNFIVKVVDLENAKFSFEDVEKEHIYDRFDFSKFSLDSIYLTASKFKIVADTVSMEIKDLTCVDDFSKIKVHNLDTEFGICEHYMKLEKLDLALGNSKIKDKIVFNYNGFRQLSYIEDSVWLDINLVKSFIDTKDAAIFFPELKSLKDKWYVAGQMKGFFYDFNIKNFEAGFGAKSLANGNIRFQGLPDIYNTKMSIVLKNSSILPEDLKQYGLSENITHIRPFGKSNITGEFIGKYHDFHFDGDLKTQLGEINGDFNLKFNENDIEHSSVYKGVLGLHNFNLKPFGAPNWLNQLSFHIKIDGKGFEPYEANVNASGFINKVKLGNNEFKNTFLSLRYANKKGIASLDVQDSNLVMDVIIKSDFSPEEEKINVDAHVFKADLFHLGYFKTPLIVSSDLEFNSQGFSKNNFNFDLEASNSKFSSQTSTSVLPNLSIDYINPKQGQKSFELLSNAANLKINGEFELFSLVNIIDTLSNNLSQSFEGKNIKLPNSKIAHFPNTEADFSLIFKKINPLLEIFAPEIRIATSSNFQGHLSTKKGIDLDFHSKIDSLLYNKVLFLTNEVDCKLTQDRNSNTIEASFHARSDKQNIDKEPTTENTSLNAKWTNNLISFDFFTKQQNEPNLAQLTGELKIKSDEKNISFSKADINFLDNKWSINKANQIILKPNFIGFEKFELKSDSQIVSLQGELSKNTDKKFDLIIKNFRVQNLEKIVGRKMKGTLEGFLTIQDFYSEPKINSNIKANSLIINKLYIGNISGKSHWDNLNKKIDLNLDIERFGSKMFSLHGNYTPGSDDKDNRLNLIAILNKTKLIVFEPFISDVFSDLQGDATGLITLRGNLSNPIINGEIDIENGGLKVNYLNSTYYFNEKISINPTGFILNNIVLDDHKGGLAVVEGGIYHSNFKDFKIRIGGEFKNIQLLNTTSNENEIYFGQAIGTGNFSLNGNFNAIDIYLKANALKGTSLSIVYNSASSTQGQSFIKFVGKDNSPTSTKAKLKVVEKADEFKIKAHLDIDISDEAYAEFVLDKNTGDKIAGYGQGSLSMDFSTDDEFSMTGDYTFSRDSYYLFTFLNVINKKFTIQRGSRVQWNGDPAAGILDVTARYEDRIPLYPLVDSVYWNRSGIRTPYPVATILFVKGEILKPEISYDIKIYNYPAAISDVPLFSYISAFENKIKNNVNEMNTQVFSLLVFRRFLYGTSGLEGAAGSTVSELLTNQLSQIVSELDKNLQVDLRMNGLDRAALNSFQVRISYELLDGKVRITRSGGVTNAQSQATTSSIIGDISVEYMLTNDGKFRLKGFTRQNPNSLSISSGSQGNSSTGASLLHTTSFDTLNPFDKKKKKKKSSTKEIKKAGAK